MNERLYFNNIRESRESYFVEYQPPTASTDFATLNVIFLLPLTWEDVSEHLDQEVRYWIGRYPVPMMVWAFNNKEDILESPDGKERVLVVWKDTTSGDVHQSWDIDDLTAHLKNVQCPSDWRSIYNDVPVRTESEVKQAANDSFILRIRQARILKILLTLWLAAIPAGYAIFEFLGPEWLALLGLVFVLWKAGKTALRLWGRTKPSTRPAEKAEKNRKMRHYFYHCERNPEGFLRLKLENLENDAREKIHKEAEELANKKPQQ